jgi:predicted nuclease of predicted toxin-antitoxin system
MTWAADNGCVVVTHDLDFGALLAVTSGGRPSVAQVRMRDLLAPQYLDRLTESLETFEAEITDGALIVVEPLRARVRILPLK